MDETKFCLGLTSSTKDVILDCINNGFTMFDGASIYSGQYNLRDVIHENNILRSNLFIMSKLWLDEYGKNRLYDTHDWGNECIETNTRKLINKLNCDYIDCLFIHWPLKLDEDFITDEFIIPEIWIQMENLVNKGLIKHIGLSNFGILEIQSILNICKIKPYINQVEINLYNNNNDIIQFCKKNNIKTMAHSSFRLNQCMNEPLLNELEEKYGFSKYAIIINWLFSKGVIPIISSSKIENLQKNFVYNKFTLLEEDILNLDKFNRNETMRMYDYSIHHLEHDYKYTFNKYCVTYCDNENLQFNDVCTDDPNFLKNCRDSLTTGPGFIILKNIFSDEIEFIRNKLPIINNDGRYDANIFNRDLVFCRLIDNILVKTIIESILGWGYHLDNTAFSYQRKEKNISEPFGPHIDSPFDTKPGAILPPCEYPLVLQTLFIFDDMNKNNGGFYVIPYSHKKRLRCNLPFGKVPEDAFEIKANAGDIIIAVGNIWHGAFKNEAETDRRILLAEFVSSIIEKRDHLGDGGIAFDMNILKDCSRRMIRLLNEGRPKWREERPLLNEWKIHQPKLVMEKH